MNTLVLFDVARQSARRRLESLLRAEGFVWLFPYARWSSRSLAGRENLARRVRSRLRGEAHLTERRDAKRDEQPRDAQSHEALRVAQNRI